MAYRFQRPRLYAYNAETKEYLTEVRPDIDVEALKNDELSFFQPAHTTEVVPPPKEDGKARVWDEVNSVWVQTPDHRGQLWYTTDGMPVNITEIGDPSVRLGLVPDKPVRPPLETTDPKQILRNKLSDIVQIAGSYTSIGQPVPADIIAEQQATVQQLREALAGTTRTIARRVTVARR